MVEQAGGGPENGSQVPAAGARQFRAIVLVRRPRVLASQPHPGGVGAPPGGTTAPCRGAG